MIRDARCRSGPDLDATSAPSPWAFRGLLLTLLYLSTPHITTLAPRGMLDALSAAVLALALCHLVCLVPRRTTAMVATALVLLLVTYNTANRFYYDQQQTYLSIHTLYLARESASFLAALPRWQLGSGIAALAGATLAIYLLARRSWPTSHRSSVPVALALLLAGIGLQTAHAALTDESTFRIEDTAPLGYMARSTGYVPFVRPDGELTAKMERDALVRLLRADPSFELPSRYSASNLVRLMGGETTEPDDAMDREAHVGSMVGGPAAALPAPEPLNVLVLLLESVRASEMGVHGAEHTATPFLDSLARDNVRADRFYATSNFTVKSEHAIHCGTLDFMIGPPIAKRELDVRTRCLPETLRQAGYRTLWLHGNSKEFYSRTDYLPRIGFDEVLSRDELDPDGSLPTLGWGLPDELVLDEALERLSAQESPFYAEVLTLSNHMPFDYDWGIDFPAHLEPADTMHERYRRGIHYTDRAVEAFYEKFVASELAGNTILVVTGDHGIWTFEPGDKSQLVKNEEFFRVPFILRTPDGRRGVVAGNASHLDVAPTIAGLLGLDDAGDFLGRSLLDDVPPSSDRAIYLMTEQALSYRLGDRACLPSVQCESNLNCYRRHGDALPEPICYRIENEGDLLRGARFSSLPPGTLDQARDRALFDYSQIVLETGPLRYMNPGLPSIAAPGPGSP